MKRLFHSSIVVAAALLLAVRVSAATTVTNLQKAYEGEMNAAAKYTKFAAKADAEGYANIASMFRAIAAAERVHAKNFQETIKEMGGKLKPAKIATVKVGSTLENLKAALAGETYEATKMYPEMLSVAQKENASRASVVINYALGTEREHQKLFSGAIKNLKKGPKTTYYVCRICGLTLKELPPAVCPLCGFPKEEYKPVS